MKRIEKHSILLGLLLMMGLTSQAQNGCVQCNGSSATGNNASAIGYNTTASGNNAFAGGYGSQASGSNSFAFGYNSQATQNTNFAIGNAAQATGIGSAALGTNVKASAQNSFAIGAGTTTSYPLTNNTPYSIALGVNSNKPTLLITKAMNNNYTGKVAIGQVTSPQTKLHIKADSNEDAGLFLEPTNKNTKKAFLQLYDANHTISVGKSASMDINAGDGSVNLMGEHYCFGSANGNRARLYTDGNAALYYNVKRDKSTELREHNGPAFAIDFAENALRFRVAKHQDPRGSEITNWTAPLQISTEGDIGMNGTIGMNGDIGMEGNIGLNGTIGMEGNIGLNGQISLSGKIGINTDRVLNDYALAVNGGIITTKVFVKEVNHWPDHVFSEHYSLPRLEELKSYLSQHRHLPGVPSEEEVVQNGYDLQEMQFVMMEKIEEMTLYLLQLQEEIDSLKARQPQDNKNVRFSYDENGNRVARYFEFKKMDGPQQDPKPHGEGTYELFPNPTPGQFSLVLKDAKKDTRLHAKLLSPAGTVLEEREITETRTIFDLSRQADGMYLLETDGPDGQQTWKVIKRQP